MKCPVCGKDYLVTYNEALAKDPVACSYKCRAVKAKQTSLMKYGIVAPGNNTDAKAKRKQTMLERYGVEFAMECPEIKQKAKDSLLSKYGVSNIQQLTINGISFAKNTANRQHEELLNQFPLKLKQEEQSPMFKIDESNMSVFLLTRKASKTFLSQYGFQLNPHFKKKHLSLGLVDDGILYQVIRFELMDDYVTLVNFGTRFGYYNPNQYDKLINVARTIYEVTDYNVIMPRGKVTEQLLSSLQIKLLSQGAYDPYWIIDDKLVKVNRKNNTEEMHINYNYITTDYLDLYHSV